MQYRAAFWTLLSSSFLLALAASSVSAGVDSWHFGAGFSVGGIHFRVGYAGAGPFGSSFFFEAGQPFRYRGYACSSYCYRRGRRNYHHPTCSVISHHFGRHGYAPGYYIEQYGPPIIYRPPPHYYGVPPTCCGPPQYYHGAPIWWGSILHNDRYRKPGHYRGHRPRGHYDNHDRHRSRYDQNRYQRDSDDRDRHNHGGIDQGPPERDRKPRERDRKPREQ